MNFIKNNKRKIIVGLVAIAWMVIIFLFSNQNGTQSGGLSNKIVDFIIDIFIPKYDNLPLEERRKIYSNISLVVRKGAHMSEYAILALLVFLFLLEKPTWFKFSMPIAFVMLFAASDEFHQKFVSGRSGSVLDIAIDTFGAVLIMTLIGVITLIIKRVRTKKEAKKDIKIG